MSTKKLLQAAAGSASGDPVYVEDVFSTHLYTGSNGVASYVNNIDLSGEGGLVWIKSRGGSARDHRLFDTERGVHKYLDSAGTGVEATSSYSLTAFNNNGFTLGDDVTVNFVQTYASWTFRKQKGFFDCVKFSTTSGGGQQTVSHNLGSIPGTIIIKQITSGADGYWYVFNKSVTSPNSDWWLNYANLNINAAFGYWGSTAGIYSAPTSSAITVSTYFTNQTADFIAYFFAEGGSDDQIFGTGGDEAIIKCGTYTTDGSGYAAVTLGFEPQWVISKKTDGAQNWLIGDNMRGATRGTTNPILRADTSDAEQDLGEYGSNIPTATGFINNYSAGSGTFAYIAIRRGPMKEPSAGTDVFSMAQPTSNAPLYKTGNLVDMAFNRQVHTAADFYLQTRLLSGKYLRTNTTDAASTDSSSVFDYQTGYYNSSYNDTNAYGWAFRRFPKVFDVVVGKSDASGNVWNGSHNLNANIEFAIVKNTQRASTQWWTAHLAAGKFYKLNQDAAGGNLGTDFTTTTTTFKAFSGYLENNEDFIMYAFSTLAGVSKVGSYTGTGNDLNVDCGFSGGARFVMVKRTDNTGDWYVYDSTRGIVSGNDPYLFINSNAAQVTNTDYIDPHSSGFTVTSSAPAGLNASGGTYIYLAFA